MKLQAKNLRVFSSGLAAVAVLSSIVIPSPAVGQVADDSGCMLVTTVDGTVIPAVFASSAPLLSGVDPAVQVHYVEKDSRDCAECTGSITRVLAFSGSVIHGTGTNLGSIWFIGVVPFLGSWSVDYDAVTGLNSFTLTVSGSNGIWDANAYGIGIGASITQHLTDCV